MSAPAAIKKPVEWDDATLEDAIAGKFKVARFGQNVPYKLSAVQRAEYENAKRLGYIVRNSAGNKPVENAYWQWCEIHKLPVVSVRKKRLYATISADMIVASAKLDKAAMKLLEALRTGDQRSECYERWADDEPRVCYAMVEHIPVADAESVAVKVSAIALDCIKRLGGSR